MEHRSILGLGLSLSPLYLLYLLYLLYPFCPSPAQPLAQHQSPAVWL